MTITTLSYGKGFTLPKGSAGERLEIRSGCERTITARHPDLLFPGGVEYMLVGPGKITLTAAPYDDNGEMKIGWQVEVTPLEDRIEQPQEA